MTQDLVSRVVWLCRALRERGLLVTTAHAGDAVRALQAGAVRSRDHTYLALRCVLASRPEDYPIFDEVFWRAFAPPSGEARRTDGSSATRRRPPEPRGPAHPSLSRWLQQGEEEAGDETEEVPGASDRRPTGVNSRSWTTCTTGCQRSRARIGCGSETARI